MDPLFSFVIPVYNVKSYLERCLDSILAQDYDSWEAILVDDGSTDESGEICDEYAARDKRFKVFHKLNGGVSSARNVGLNNVCGQWIWFVDSDDCIVDNALSCLYEYIISYKCDTIFFGMKIVHINSTTTVKPPYLTGLAKTALLSQISCFANPTMIFDSSIIKKHSLRFTEGIRMAEDLEFQYKYLAYNKSPISVDNCLYIYNCREASAMNNPLTDTNNFNDCLAVAINLARFIDREQIPYSDWLMVRIRQIIKSGMQSASKIKTPVNFKSRLCEVIMAYSEIGWDKIADTTIKLAMQSTWLYLNMLKLYIRFSK